MTIIKRHHQQSHLSKFFGSSSTPISTDVHAKLNAQAHLDAQAQRGATKAFFTSSLKMVSGANINATEGFILFLSLFLLLKTASELNPKAKSSQKSPELEPSRISLPGFSH